MSHFNGVRVFGTGAGNMKDPPAAAELLRWIRRAQHTIEGWLARYGTQSLHEKGSGDVVSVAEIVLFNFFEFLDECYLVDMAKGSGKTVSDPYGNSVVEAWPRIEAFVEKFKSRECVKKDLSNGEMPSDGNLAVMRTWWEKPE
ncbi:hypothetical protein FH972_024182 [Carpinus fangiana]|uniref:Uncharacterized protein n=1 Tax=Carpinus fangiana TaxID=176857 RepID=A0A5N6KXB2_9ROSI|nr:hypothetical protein FH972_024182 [Carpinus fangiana]